MTRTNALLSVFAILFSFQTHASCTEITSSSIAIRNGGDKGGNAGSGMEILFRAKAEEVLNWVKVNRLSKIDTHGYDRGELSDKLLTQKWRVCMSDEKIYVDSRERTCRNSFDPLRPDLIECSAEAFERRESDDSRYALVFHELLGVAGVERNLERESDDSISRQIVRFIGRKTVPYLANEQINNPAKVTFIKNPVHQETGLPFTAYLDTEANLICKYLGFNKYIIGSVVFANDRKSNGKKSVLLEFVDSGFKLVDFPQAILELACR
jgi:hypothetical protein